MHFAPELRHKQTIMINISRIDIYITRTKRMHRHQPPILAVVDNINNIFQIYGYIYIIK